MSTPEDSPLPSTNDAQLSTEDSGFENSATLANRLLALLVALATWIVSVGLLLLPQLLALPYIISRYAGTRPTPEQLLADKTLVIILVAGILPAHLITLVIAWCVVTRFGKVPAREALRWRWSNRMGIAKCIVLAILLLIAAWLLAIRFGGSETDLQRIINSSRAAALIIAFLAVATAPLVEEIIYRGILFPAWQRLTGSIAAVVIVTLMFAILHIPQYWPNFGVISSITMLSVVLTAIRAYTGRLLPCFVIHLVFNGIQSLIIAFEPYIRSLYRLWRSDSAAGIIHYLYTMS